MTSEVAPRRARRVLHAMAGRQGGSAMNIHTTASTNVPAGISAAEWEARVDLAAVYRLVAHYGWGDGLFNHCSMGGPGEDRKFLMKRAELLWTQGTPPNL